MTCDASFEQCLASHPAEAYEMLAEVSPHCRSAERIRAALSGTTPGGPNA